MRIRWWDPNTSRLSETSVPKSEIRSKCSWLSFPKCLIPQGVTTPCSSLGARLKFLSLVPVPGHPVLSCRGKGSQSWRYFLNCQGPLYFAYLKSSWGGGFVLLHVTVILRYCFGGLEGFRALFLILTIAVMWYRKPNPVLLLRKTKGVYEKSSVGSCFPT